MKDLELVPDPSLLFSMRSLDYSLASAIADIVDNSISVNSTMVDIKFSSENSTPFVSVIDDGTGMSKAEIKEAMKLGAKNPLAFRSEDELGRFGLGLKTASLSQARTLTVISFKNNEISCLRWDLDHLAQSASWTIQELTLDEIKKLPTADAFLTGGKGTLVLWTKLDNLGEGEPRFSENLDAGFIEVRQHLSLVFHRFMSGELSNRKVQISLNEVLVKPADPFLSKSSRTIKDPIQEIAVGEGAITVQAFTLPYISQMTKEEREVAMMAGGLRESQGFYVYRANRLITWGTWFKLAPLKELGKLSRVRVDVPNSLDHLWKLTVTKTRLIPPLEIREALRRLTGTFTVQSKKVFTHKGESLLNTSEIEFPWQVHKSKEGEIKITINRNFPLLTKLTDELTTEQLSMLNSVVTAIELGLPMEALYLQVNSDRQSDQVDVELLWQAIKDMWNSYPIDVSVTEFVDSVLKLAPFNQIAEKRSELINDLSTSVESH